MTVRLALLGDTMLGRGVADALRTRPPRALVAPEVVELTRSADLCVANLECCVSARGRPWPSPGKPFYFRAPPKAVELLQHLGVGAVTLANNHALDYGTDALHDTLKHLRVAGITTVGAGPDEAAARRPAELTVNATTLTLIGVTDHPADFAAGPDSPGVAWADLRRGAPEWLLRTVRQSPTELTVVTPHWGPNMTSAPVGHVRRAAAALQAAGATLIAGHSAHVPHGVAGPVLFDLGDFLDDYAVDPHLRNDLSLLFLVELGARGPQRIEAVPLKLDYCHTRMATGEDAAWISARFRRACRAFGTTVTQEDGTLVIQRG